MIVGDDDSVGADHEARAERSLTLEAILVAPEELVEAFHRRAFRKGRQAVGRNCLLCRDIHDSRHQAFGKVAKVLRLHFLVQAIKGPRQAALG